jgi:hypothetical protein
MGRILCTDDGNYNGRLEFRTTASGGHTGIQPAIRMVIKATGNVGIGSISPSQKLDVNGAAIFGAGTTRLTTYSDSGYAGIYNGSSLTSDESIYMGGGNIFFYGDGAEKMRINSSGNVGIGTTSPTATLDIKGDGAEIFLKSADYSVARIIPRGTGSNLDKGLLSLFDAGTEDVRIDTAGNSWFNGGNVGIGQGSPTAKLHLKGDGGTSGLTFKTTDFSNNEIFYVMDGGRVGVRYWPFSIGIPSTSSLATNAVFQVEEAGLLTVLTTGNVGIGTASPSAKLEVIGTGTQLGSTGYYINSSFKGSSNVGVFLGHNNTNNGNGMVAGINKLAFLTYGTSWGERMVIDGSGNVTINAGNLFLANSSSRISNGANGEIGFNYNTGATGGLAWYGGGTSSTFSVTNTGNLSLSGHIYVSQPKTISFANAQTIRDNGGGGLAIRVPIYRLDLIAGTDAGNGHITFQTNNGTERMRVSNGGNVGIGTTSPNAVFEVTGSAEDNWAGRFENTNSGGYGILAKIAGTSANERIFEARVGTSTKMLIDGSGNVGIGTASPTTKLYIEDQGVNWNVTTPGTTLGTLHLDPVGNGANNTGNAITFGASDSSSGGTAQAGIYIRSDGSYGTKMYLATTNSYNSGSKTRLAIDHNGNVGIGVTNPSYKLHVGGSIVGTSKNFIIDHPTKEGKKLLHGCIEGPEAAVYFRGKSTSNIIEMPDYWIGLVDIDTMTVDITPWGPNQDIYVESIADDGEITIAANTEEPLNYFYVVYGERKDIDKLEIEIVDPEYSD